MARIIDTITNFLHGRMVAEDPVEALHIAAFEGDLDRIRALVKKKKVPIDSFLKSVMGATVNCTPIFLAIKEENPEAVRLLIDLGANVNAVSDIGTTPLMIASADCNVEMVRMLLSAGAHPGYVREQDDATALGFATHDEGKDEEAAEVAALLIRAGAQVDYPGPQSALMLGARADLPRYLRVLLSAGADPERQCGLRWAKGFTALDHAINEGRTRAEAILGPVTKTPPIATRPVSS